MTTKEKMITPIEAPSRRAQWRERLATFAAGAIGALAISGILNGQSVGEAFATEQAGHALPASSHDRAESSASISSEGLGQAPDNHISKAPTNDSELGSTPASSENVVESVTNVVPEHVFIFGSDFPFVR